MDNFFGKASMWRDIISEILNFAHTKENPIKCRKNVHAETISESTYRLELCKN